MSRPAGSTRSAAPATRSSRRRARCSPRASARRWRRRRPAPRSRARRPTATSPARGRCSSRRTRTSTGRRCSATIRRADPQARLAAVADDQLRRILTFEPEMRTVLRLSLEHRSRATGGPQRCLSTAACGSARSRTPSPPLRDELPAASSAPARARDRRDARHRGVRLADRHRRPVARGGGCDDARERARRLLDAALGRSPACSERSTAPRWWTLVGGTAALTGV